MPSPGRQRNPLPTTINYYPSDLPGQPFMKFSTWIMKGGTGSNIGDIHMTEVGDHVCLPIPSGVNVTYGQGWDQEDVGEVKSLVAGVGGAVADSYSSGASSGENVDAMAKSSSEAVKDTAGRVGVEGAKKGAGMGVVGSLIGTGAVQRASGSAKFSNTYATYGGPAFRTFQFAFSMKPLSYKDTTKVREILEFFKQSSAPALISGGLWRVYELPYVFKITYYDHNGRKHPHLPQISQSALTDLSVTYGGDMYTEFREGSSPVQIDLSLSFREVALLTRDDLAWMGH
jgi:hypothetical protein